MDKKEEFKKFMNSHPEILEVVKNKELSFQEMYEIYDIYGEDDKVWNKYFNKNVNDKLTELTSLIKNVNLDNIEKHINNAQRAIGIIQELTKKEPVINTVINNPVTKFFGD